MTVLRLLTSYWPWEWPSALLQENARLESRIELLEQEAEHLGMLNEELRRWMMANVAVATRVGQMLGAVDESVTPKNGPPLARDEEVNLFGGPDKKAINGQYPSMR